MSVFAIENAWQAKEISQLFMMFADTSDKTDVLATQIARYFPSSAIVVVCPDQAFLYQDRLRGLSLLNDEELKAMVSQHFNDIQGFIKTFQAHLGMSAQVTALIGMGQMGSLVLELTKLTLPLAGRVISFGSRYASLPTQSLSLEQTIHLLHAKNDSLVPVQHLLTAQEAIAQLEGDATIDLAHLPSSSLDETLMAQMIQRLQTCVPLRYWKEAQSASSEDLHAMEPASTSIH